MKKIKRDVTLSWVVYIVACSDKTLYTGITTDLVRRLSEHEKGKGAKYTRGRGPLEVIYTETHQTRSEASKRELQIKSLDKSSKLKLLNDPHNG